MKMVSNNDLPKSQQYEPADSTPGGPETKHMSI